MAAIAVVVFAFLTIVPCGCEEFVMGYLTGSRRMPGNIDYGRPGLMISGAISLAVDEINTMSPLYGNNTLSFIVAETYGEETVSIRKTAELQYLHNISAYIGPQETCVVEAKMAASFNRPMISYFCARFETSDKSMFPTFARTRPTETQISTAVASVLLNFNWKLVAFLYSNESSSSNEVPKSILKTFKNHGIGVTYENSWDVTYYYGFVDNPFDRLVEESYKQTRIYVILGYYDDHLGLMVSLYRKGLLDKGEYFVVGLDITQYIEYDPGRFMRGLLRDQIDEEAKIAFASYIGVVATVPDKSFKNFTEKINEYIQKEPFNFQNPLTVFGVGARIPAEAAYLYDAVYLYAKALNSCLSNSQDDPYDGKTIFNYIKGQSYKSAMGYLIYMDENGDAEGNYTLIARKPVPGTPGEYGLYSVGIFQQGENQSSLPNLLMTDTINWLLGEPPQDQPICGFNNEKCRSDTGKIAGGIAGGVGFVSVIILLILYRNWIYEQELDSLLWKIDYKDLIVNDSTPTTNNNSLNRTKGSQVRSSQVSLISNPETDFRYSTIYARIAIYRGNICAVKKIKKKGVDITRAMKKELKMMRDLRHDNLNAFIGACVDPPNICIVTEYASRGSLQDIIENDDVKLDNMFVASLVADIIRGMLFLHDSPIKSHGSLKTSNCLVDSRWVVKISDFGLHDFMAGAEQDKDTGLGFETHCHELLTRAPELLRNTNPPPNGTQKGDVYSFGFILYEIHGRKGPWGEILELTDTEIVMTVMRRDRLLQPFRPSLDVLDTTLDCVKETLIECWKESPEERPDFKSIRTKLQSMRKGMKSNIFDNMIAMMEKYANNLEVLVDERTDQLNEEKKKTEALLYEMLPRYVADELKRGRRVEAESFDCVTIYFSDIVGFTSMSAESSPLQVVDFLNDLYTCFDSIIENYDVYKIETIGDAYMVVSGLPVRNGNQHAGEIASMSLHLLDKVKRFKIRHRPLDTLKLRIGIHSGPVCAGVVGLKMPRYCLFGDTVNTASRLESTGTPLMIHTSEQCKYLLASIGGYELDSRGLVSLKGKGEVRTFWLTGESKANKEKRFRDRLACSASSKMMNGVIQGPRSSMKKIRCPGYSIDSSFKCKHSDGSKRLRFMSVKERVRNVSGSASSAPIGSPLKLDMQTEKKQNSCPSIDNCDICYSLQNDEDEVLKPRVDKRYHHTYSGADDVFTPLLDRKGTNDDLLIRNKRHKMFGDKSHSIDSSPCHVDIYCDDSTGLCMVHDDTSPNKDCIVAESET
ncbi:Uncharacterised protein g121 [Pycnogonum litorale]